MPEDFEDGLEDGNSQGEQVNNQDSGGHETSENKPEGSEVDESSLQDSGDESNADGDYEDSDHYRDYEDSEDYELSNDVLEDFGTPSPGGESDSGDDTGEINATSELYIYSNVILF